MKTTPRHSATSTYFKQLLKSLAAYLQAKLQAKTNQSLHAKWLRAGVAFLSGLLFAFGFSPYEFWGLNLLSMVLLLLLINNYSLKQVTMLSFCYGLGVYFHGISWVFVSIHTFGNTPLIAAIPLTIGFVSIFTIIFTCQCWLSYKISRNNYAALTFPVVWTLFEWVRSWIFTGCPWLLSGYSYIDTPLAGYAPLFGVYGVSFFAVLTAALIASITLSMIQPRKHHSKPLLSQPLSSPASASKQIIILSIMIISIWGIGFGLTHYDWVKVNTHDQNRLQVSLIQGNIPQDQKWVPENLQPTLDLYQQLTVQELTSTDWQPDLVIWPEAALPIMYRDAAHYLESLDEILLSHQASLITGILSTTNNDKKTLYHNSIIALGRADGIYHKQKLVPFGEVYPFTESLRSIIPFYGQLNSFTPGDQDQPLLVASGHAFASYICYEVIYPDFARQQAKHADFLLTISNDAWFGDSIAPWQHFQMTRMRALENGRFMIRGTNTGISGLIDQKGKIVSTAPQFEQLVHRATLYAIKDRTPFSYWGSAPILGFALFLLLFGYITKRTLSRTQPPKPGQKP